MMKSIALAAAFGLAPLAVPTAASAATLVGSSVKCSTNTFPSSKCNGAQQATAIVDGGVEFDIFATPFDPAFKIDFGADFFTLDVVATRFIQSTVLKFTLEGRDWASIGGGGLLNSRGTIDGNVLSLNLAGRTYTAGETFTFNVSAVPEPGTWMLMILGLGAVGFAMRRRQTTSTRYQFA
jgi:hypothetical protein